MRGKEAAMRTSKPITVTLGKQQASLDARIKSGAYASASEVMRAALRALDREEAALDEIMRRKISTALESQGPDVSATEVFRKLRAHHEKRLRDAGHGA
jgi:antitoxin ParD1/3/4